MRANFPDATPQTLDIVMHGFRLCFFLLTLFLAVLLTGIADQQAAEPKGDWQLVWSDEFEGEQIDPKKWDFDLGNGFFNYDGNVWISGWGNGELEYYTKEPENAAVQDGMLRLRAIKESYQGCGYTSARLKTRKRDGSPLFNTKYGRIEFRAKLPTGQGIWPAVWMLPQSDKYGTWASSGEIDILEARGQKPAEVLGTLHYGGRWPANASSSRTYEFPKGQSFDDFHVYALDWEPGVIRWYVDDQLYATQDFWWSTSRLDGDKGAKPNNKVDLNAWPAPFDEPFYLIINLAVGGQFLGNPDKTTQFPAEMLVDYVRVYQRRGGYAPVGQRGAGALPFKE